MIIGTIAAKTYTANPELGRYLLRYKDTLYFILHDILDWR